MRLALISTLMAAFIGGPALADLKVGVIASSTGPISSVGVQQKNTVDLLPAKIGDLAVQYIYLDDNSDPTQTSKNVQKLLTEDKIDVLLGPSGSPNAMAVINFLAESKTPMLANVGSAAVVLPMDDVRKWIFKTTQNDNLVMDAITAHMKATGIKTVAYFGTNDPLGENFFKVFSAAAAAAGIEVVADERFARADTSVTGQALKIRLAKPDAVLVGASGATTVLPQATLVDQGYAGKIYQTHGAATPGFLKLGGAKVNGTILAASPMLVLADVGDDLASKKVAQAYIDAYKAKHGEEPGTFGANIYDGGLLLEAAVPVALAKAEPGTVEFREALRDALENTHELVGTQGVFNMTPEDHSGFDDRSIVMIEVVDGQWTLLK